MTGYIIGIIIGSILILIGLSFLIFLFIKNKRHYRKIKLIGQSAETKINSDIKTWATQTKNLFIKNHLYKYEKNKVFEVDSILITSKAIYVVEIKSIKGIIKGDATLSKWEKKLGDNKFPITNAIIQNDRHIEHITKMINTKAPMISLIIYSNRADYLNIQNVPEHAAVIKHSQLFDVLDGIEQNLPIKFSIQEMQIVFKKIKSFISNKQKDIALHKRIVNQK